MKPYKSFVYGPLSIQIAILRPILAFNHVLSRISAKYRATFVLKPTKHRSWLSWPIFVEIFKTWRDINIVRSPTVRQYIVTLSLHFL